MNRTTILSHGGMHDAKGVSGTHLKGSVPAPAVLDAIPPAIGTVGNVPETARPGQGPVTRSQVPGEPVNTDKRRRWFDDEGNPDFPPRGGPSTQRPGPETTTAEAEPQEQPAEAPGGAAGASLLPPPSPEPEARDEVSQSETDTPVTGTSRLDLSKRKLQRATVEQLRSWCIEAGIIPEEYVDDDAEVTGALMRQLLAEKFDIAL
jgi:hypothetical protein